MSDRILVNTDLLDRCAKELTQIAAGFGEAAAILSRLDTGDEWWSKMGKLSPLQLSDEGSRVALGNAGSAVRTLDAALRRYNTRATKLSRCISGVSAMFASVEGNIAAAVNGKSAGSTFNVDVIAGSISKPIDASIGASAAKAIVDSGKQRATDETLDKSALRSAGAEAVEFFTDGLLEWRKTRKNLGIYARLKIGDEWKIARKRFFGFADKFGGRVSKAGWMKLSPKATWFQKAMTTDGWKTRFYNNFQKLDGPLDAYKSGGTKAASAYGSLIISAVVNGWDNYEEYKSNKITKERAVMETVMETAVDAGKDWLIGTAVAAGMAATIGSAPVLAVGAATVGVTLGLDWACKKVTGLITGEEKNLTETVSDFVLDVGKGAVSVAKKIAKSVKKPIITTPILWFGRAGAY